MKGVVCVLSILLLVFGVAAHISAGEPKEGAEGVDMFFPPDEASKVVAWKGFHEDPAAKMADVWSIADGLILCKGSPNGYIRTEQDFTNFELTLEWRRPADKQPGRGGVLIRTTGPDQIWPRSLEAQLNAGAAGDFWGLIGYPLEGPAERMQVLEHPKYGKLTNVKKVDDLEKLPGEWNRYEIVARGEVVILRINGREVNRATGCEVVPGKICLTSEGDEIHFRNVRIRPLPGPK